MKIRQMHLLLVYLQKNYTDLNPNHPSCLVNLLLCQILFEVIEMALEHDRT